MQELRRSLRVSFPGSEQRVLAGIVDQPVEDARGFLLFSHCFTCTKDLKAIVRISRRLAEHGWGVLRFDFAGLGMSEGDFSTTNFTTNQIDLTCAAQFLEANFQAPKLLIGHSFGGAVSLSMAEQFESVRGVAALAAPSDTTHLADLLLRLDPNIGSLGEGTVTIGGYQHRIRRQMIEDFRQHDLPATVARLTKPAIIFHSPEDETVGYHHAMRLFGWLSQRSEHQPKAPGASLITLHGADHLMLNHSADVKYVGDSIHVWLTRLLTEPQSATTLS